MFLMLRKLGLEWEFPFPFQFQKFAYLLEVTLSSSLRGSEPMLPDTPLFFFLASKLYLWTLSELSDLTTRATYVVFTSREMAVRCLLFLLWLWITKQSPSIRLFKIFYWITKLSVLEQVVIFIKFNGFLLDWCCCVWSLDVCWVFYFSLQDGHLLHLSFSKRESATH